MNEKASLLSFIATSRISESDFFYDSLTKENKYSVLFTNVLVLCFEI